MRKKKRSIQKRLILAKYFLNIILALILIIFGASLIFWATLRQDFGWQATKRPPEQVVSSELQIPIEKPVKIYIPKMGRTLDVSDGYIENGRWKVAISGVSYLTSSGQVGMVGNAVIYGHNTQSILGGLWRVQNGDSIEVTAGDGKVYKYEIFERKEVKPNQVEILTQTDDARLTIYTCSGFLDSARFVVVGKLVEGY